MYLHSITPDTDLVHMAIYDVEISYQDVANNVLASAQNTGATFDILTETPTFTTPAHQSYPVETFLIQFTLPEDAMLLNHLAAELSLLASATLDR